MAETIQKVNITIKIENIAINNSDAALLSIFNQIRDGHASGEIDNEDWEVGTWTVEQQ